MKVILKNSSMTFMMQEETPLTPTRVNSLLCNYEESKFATSSNGDRRVYYVPVEQGEKIHITYTTDRSAGPSSADDNPSRYVVGFCSSVPANDVVTSEMVKTSSTQSQNKEMDEVVTAPSDGYVFASIFYKDTLPDGPLMIRVNF